MVARRLFIIILLLLIASTAQAAGLLTGMTPSNYQIPQGWNLLATQNFESASCPPTQSCDQWETSITSSRAHNSTYSLGGPFTHDQAQVFWQLNTGNTGSYTDLYASFYEYVDEAATFNDEWTIWRIATSTPAFTEIMVDWFWAYDPATMDGMYNSDYAELAFITQGTWTKGYWGVKRAKVPTAGDIYGGWHQWEVWFHPNTIPDGLDGFLRVYLDGNLYASRENVKLTSVSTDNFNVRLGGYYTKLVWTDYPYGGCPAVGDLDVGRCCDKPGADACPGSADWCSNESGWYGQQFSSPRCYPTDPALSSFNRYIDDVIVMKKSSPPGTDVTPPYASNFSPARSATNVPVTTTQQYLTVSDSGVGVVQGSISMNGPDGVKTCSTGSPALTCSGTTAAYNVTYPGMTLSYGQTASFTLTAQDSNGNTLNTAWVWDTEPGAGGGLNITTTSLPSGVESVAYSQSVSATGGTGPYYFDFIGSDLTGSTVPRSALITSGTWDFANEVTGGPGSDMWSSTWGPDGNVWTAWGDGGGYNGTNDICRTRQGIGYFTHTPPASPVFVDVYGCKEDGSGCIDSPYDHDPSCNAPNASGNYGWTNSVLYVDGDLYQLSGRQDATLYIMDIYKSTNDGQSFSLTSSWSAASGTFRPQSWVQYDADYASGGSYVYLIGVENMTYPHNGVGEDLYLARATKANAGDSSQYEFFTGSPSSVTWGTWANRKPIISDPAYFGWESMSYNDGLSRYILSGKHGTPVVCYPDPSGVCWTTMNYNHVYESPNIYGPWSVVERTNGWHGFTGSEGGGTAWGLQVLFPTKYMSGDGKTMYAVWSGGSTWDRYNQVKYTLTTSTNFNAPPGLSLSTSGDITGTPTLPGVYNFRVRVTDAVGDVDYQSLSILIEPGEEPDTIPPVLASSSPSSGQANWPLASREVTFDITDAGDVDDTSLQFNVDGGSTLICGSGLSCAWIIPNTQLRATYNRGSDWTCGTTYTLNIPQVKDVTGNTLATSWLFSTVACLPDTGPGGDFTIHIHED